MFKSCLNSNFKVYYDLLFVFVVDCTHSYIICTVCTVRMYCTYVPYIRMYCMNCMYCTYVVYLLYVLYVHMYCMYTVYTYESLIGHISSYSALPVSCAELLRLRQIKYTFNLVMFLVASRIIYLRFETARIFWAKLTSFFMRMLASVGLNVPQLMVGN